MNEIQAMYSIVKEIGIGAICISAIIWIAIYLVKKFVDTSCQQLSFLVADMKVFMSKVRDEHKQSIEDHKALMEQHKEMMIQNNEMIKTLGRINGYRNG